MKSQLCRASCALSPLALALTASPAAADAVIEAGQMGADPAVGIGETAITVRGNKTRYTRVATKTVPFWLLVRGHAPDNSVRHIDSWVEVGSYRLNINAPSAQNQIFKGEFDYVAPRNGSFDAVLFCNAKLDALSGLARTNYLRHGRTHFLNDAYSADLSSRWQLKRRRHGFDELYDRTWTGATDIDAQVKCAPLDINAGATRTNPPPPPPRRTNPTPPDPSTLPRLKTATLAISPYAIEQVGADRCPTKLRLRGFIETNRKMRGKVIFVGPEFLSPPKDFDFSGAKTMNHIASYTLKWGQGGSDTLALGTGATQRQDLNFKFNVVNGRGRLVKSVTKSIRVTCE